ncbi:MAG: MFS transporter, partial [Proteobacteria bacterium]|nr:MFS transporter [Pseudomonadota bacterium]
MSSDAIIRRLVSARALNTFGRAVMSATVLWELYQRSHDELVIGAVGLVQVIPVILLFVPAGGFVDRSDRRRLTALAAGTTGAVGIGLGVCSALHAPIAMFLALLVVQGAVNAIHAPSASSLIPLIIPREDLMRTNRISASLQELAAIVGPALAGLALMFVEPIGVYVVIAITGLSAGVLYRSLPEPRAVAVDAAGTAARKDWRVGLRFIWRSPLL